MRSLTLIATLIGVFIASSASAQGTKLDPKLIQRAEKVYADQKCMMCHSIAGKGNAKGRLDDVGTRLSEEDIRQWMINPRVMTEKAKSTRKPLMPAYTKLAAEDLDAIVGYLKSLKKK